MVKAMPICGKWELNSSDLEQHAEVFLNAARAIRAHAETAGGFTYRDLSTMAVVCALIGQAYKNAAMKDSK
jgi:hypothetical protein